MHNLIIESEDDTNRPLNDLYEQEGLLADVDHQVRTSLLTTSRCM
jgi:hypothetical protein